jgi:hypothetical protein
MDLVKENQLVSEPLVSPGIKEFLEGLPFGHWGILAGRRVVIAVRKLRDPAQDTRWKRQFALPLRNAVMVNRPLAVSFDAISVALEPQGAFAAAI